MTAATGFKRLGIAIAAIVLASFAALGAMALLIPVDTVRDATKAEIRNVTGLDLVLRGDVAVSLFPTGSISFANVTLGDDAKPVLAADRLTARLRFFPLFAGRIEIADVSLVRPRINVSFDRDGHSNWAALIDTLARALGPKANRPVNATSFTEIRINDGTIALDDATRGINETFNGRRTGAGLAVDLQELRRHRPFRLARRADRRLDHADGFRRRARRRPLGPEASPHRRTGQARLRRQLEHAADAEDRRHARGRCPVAARHVALGRPQAALRRRLRPLRAQGQDQCLQRNDCALHGQRRARRQRRRGRPHLRHRRPADLAGHACRRRARSHALYFHRSPAHQQRARLEPGAARDRRPDRFRSRPAAVGGPHHHRARQARAHRHRRQPARRQAHRDDRRVAGVRRRAQGLAGARGLRCRRRVQVATAIHRRRSRKMPGRDVPVPPARRARRHRGGRSTPPATACWSDPDLERNGRV